MPLTWIDGREIAKNGRKTPGARRLTKRRDAAPCGDRGGRQPGQSGLCAQQENACNRAGIRSTVLRLPESCTQEELEGAVLALNADEQVHGILVQLPLPKGLDEARVLALIDPKKDVDGFHAMNAGKLMSGQPGFVPCTPLGVMKLLEAYDIPTRGKHAVVIGRSNIVGKPMAMLLLAADATVTICHSKTENLAEIARQADILVAAVGRPNFVTGEMIKPGAAVIDVGINRVNGELIGDVNAKEAAEKAAYLTPVPGGVGQMTIAMLLSNTLDAAERDGR
ncbi:MAG: bifunctional 5,10-methylenetetrahydrofolate dehydrogenase/5,10-methenyltetrahydrofolate cyclohydrolase [Christensenellales bacterium]